MILISLQFLGRGRAGSFSVLIRMSDIQPRVGDLIHLYGELATRDVLWVSGYHHDVSLKG